MRPLDKRNLEALPEWQELEAWMHKVAQSYFDDILELAKHGEVPVLQNFAGRIAMIRDILAHAKTIGGETPNEGNDGNA